MSAGRYLSERLTRIDPPAFTRNHKTAVLIHVLNKESFSRTAEYHQHHLQVTFSPEKCSSSTQ